MAGKRGRSGPPGNKNGLKHGLKIMKRGLKELGSRAIDGRSALGKALFKWRAELISDLGGHEAISTQQEAVVNLCVRSKLMLDSIDTWILTQRSLINARKRFLLPVVRGQLLSVSKCEQEPRCVTFDRPIIGPL